jgi:uncharacterized tellurite resistance protein B-like protein
MSLSDLLEVPPEDRDLFVRWMVKIARADGVLANSELSAIHELTAAWNLSISELRRLHHALRNGPELGANAPVAFLHPRSPYLLVRTLIQLSYEDGAYDESERRTVIEVARRYRVPTARVRDFEKWVRVHIDHLNQGRALLQP